VTIIAYTEIIMAKNAEVSCQALMAPYELTAWYGIGYWHGIWAHIWMVIFTSP
jgi:hypothetical protein